MGVAMGTSTSRRSSSRESPPPGEEAGTQAPQEDEEQPMGTIDGLTKGYEDLVNAIIRL